MTKEFVAKVLNQGCVDTRTYRYIVKEVHDAENQWQRILRLPISELGTTSALDGWEVVADIK